MQMSIRSALLGLTSLAAATMVVAQPAAAQADKPNILFIMSDDVGW